MTRTIVVVRTCSKNVFRTANQIPVATDNLDHRIRAVGRHPRAAEAAAMVTVTSAILLVIHRILTKLWSRDY
jgi:hypothetical protein